MCCYVVALGKPWGVVVVLKFRSSTLKSQIEIAKLSRGSRTLQLCNASAMGQDASADANRYLDGYPVSIHALVSQRWTTLDMTSCATGSLSPKRANSSARSATDTHCVRRVGVPLAVSNRRSSLSSLTLTLHSSVDLSLLCPSAPPRAA